MLFICNITLTAEQMLEIIDEKTKIKENYCRNNCKEIC